MESSIIPRTVQVILEPGRTKPNPFRLYGTNKKDNDPDLYAFISGQCNSVLNSGFEQQGCILTVLHGIYDCEKASKDIKTGFDKDGMNVNLYDCDNTTVSECFPESHLLKAGLRYGLIRRHPSKRIASIMTLCIALILPWLGWLLTYFDKIVDPRMGSKFIYGAGFLSLLLVSFALYYYKSDKDEEDISLFTDLLHVLPNLAEDKLSDFFTNYCQVKKSKLSDNSINIFVRFDKLEQKDRPAYYAIKNYLEQTKDLMLTVSADVKRPKADIIA